MSPRRIVAGLLAAGILGGCGTTGGRSHAARTAPPPPAPVPAHPRRVPSGPFRWLVRTAGPQPSVASENRHRGTRSWRLPGPAVDVGGVARGPVAGYVAEPAISPVTSSGYTSTHRAPARSDPDLQDRLVRRRGRAGGAGLGRAAGRPAAAVRAQLPDGAHRVRLASNSELPNPLSASERRVHRRPLLAQGRARLPVRRHVVHSPATARTAPHLHLRGIQRVGRRQPVPGRRRSGRDHRHHAGRRGLLRPPV